MNAIELLIQQHRDVDMLFAEIEKADGREKMEIFNALADALAVHATMEERHFYPAAARAMGDPKMLKEAVEEHLSVKRIIADLLEMRASDDMFEAKVKVLKEQIRHHVKEEEGELFPRVKKAMDEEQLIEVCDEMLATEAELREEGDPRDNVPGEISEAAPI